MDRFKVLINWQGEVITFYTHARDKDKALKNCIRQLAKKVGYSIELVRKYVMDENKRRWEVTR